MKKPDLSRLRRHVLPRQALFEKGKPNAIPADVQIHKCCCCNDTGIVSAWKLTKFFPEVFGDYLDPITSMSVYCQHHLSCGDYKTQVFENDKRGTAENASRTQVINLFRTTEGNTAIGAMIAAGTAKCLSFEESRYIHEQVLKMRVRMNTPEGQEYIAEISKRAKEALRPKAPHVAPGRLTPISDLAVPFEMPPEPNWDDLDEIRRDEIQTGDEPQPKPPQTNKFTPF